jgi:hypothetical protein
MNHSAQVLVQMPKELAEELFRILNEYVGGAVTSRL